MPRIRSIKPEFWTSAQVLECSRNARLLFVGLWNFCDDAGRHPDSPKQCRAEVFPADELTADDVRGMLDELESNGLIVRYVVDGKAYFYVTGWHHQRIDKPQSPKYPGPVDDHSENIPRTFPPDRKGSEGRGGERKDRLSQDSPEGGRAKEQASARGKALPEDWELPPEWHLWAVNNSGLDGATVEREGQRFCDHWRANRNRREGKKADWLATWRNWIRRADDEHRRRRGNGSASYWRRLKGMSSPQVLFEAKRLGVSTRGKSNEQLFNELVEAQRRQTEPTE